jgi:hypothetical protein
MLYNALPAYVHTIIADYKWFDDTKTDSELSSYFDRLLALELSVVKVMLNLFS